MNKTKEQLAEEYAVSLYPDKYQDAPYTTRGDLFVLAEDSFKKGFEAAEPKWISVEERQPEESGYVLGANPDDQFICRYIKEKKQFIALGVDIIARADYSVTHWMPLPPLPSPPKQ